MENRRYKRRILIVDKKFQYKYVAIILLIMIATVVFVSMATFYVVWDKVLIAFENVPEASRKLADIMAQSARVSMIPLGILTVLFSAMGVFYSHKIAGPVYRIKKVAEDLAAGNLNVDVRFRKGDEMQELADVLNKAIANLRGIVIEDNAVKEKLQAIAEKLEQDIEKNRDLKPDVKAAIKEMHALISELKKVSGKFKV